MGNDISDICPLRITKGKLPDNKRFREALKNKNERYIE